MPDFTAVRGGTAYDNDGTKLGSIDEVYTDKDTGEPSFVTVHMGLFGSKTTFVPLAQATVEGNDLRVPYTKAHVKDAPNVDPDMDISDEEQERLYRHYGLGSSGYASTGTTGTTGYETTSATGAGVGAGVGAGTATDRDRDGIADRNQHGTIGHDTSGPTTDDAMTRSEERLTVGVRSQEAGRARLRKYVVTEQQSANVQVSREQLRVEREPITEANRGNAYDGPAISEEEHEVVLHEERAVVDKEAVPVERIRLGKETVTDTETVTGEVRKEQIELDEPNTIGTGRRDR
jgi:uncharacterized protein (TIGR02271 family)